MRTITKITHYVAKLNSDCHKGNECDETLAMIYDIMLFILQTYQKSSANL